MSLVPLFRSEQQMRLLGILFGGPETELAIGELAKLADVAQATASREVARLAAHGIVEVRALGRNTLVAPNWDLPWAQELRSILVQTIGVLGRVRDALAGLAGVEEAFIFGSWAARYRGEPGPAPRDIDLLVVGDVAVRDGAPPVGSRSRAARRGQPGRGRSCGVGGQPDQSVRRAGAIVAARAGDCRATGSPWLTAIDPLTT